MTSRPTITFDTNIPAIPEVRLFWATLCQDIGQPMTLTPTSAQETLTRIRLETERSWAKRLRLANDRLSLKWDRVRVRRLSTLAAQTARDCFAAHLDQQGSPYAKTPPPPPRIDSRIDAIDQHIPDVLFDLTTGNGMRDRKIVVEALAWQFDILASNNINSIDHVGLRRWIESPQGARLQLNSTIHRPQEAEYHLAKAYRKPPEWVVHALARASVTDPDNEQKSVRQMLQMMTPFARRGLGEMQTRINNMLEDQATLDHALDLVARSGQSLSMQAEAKMEIDTSSAIERETGLDLSGPFD